MPRFFFDVSSGGELTKDLEGTFLEHHSLVPREARRLLLDIARHLTEIPPGLFRLEVRVRLLDGETMHWSSLVLDSGIPEPGAT
jgi:hypothetical protein